MMNFNMAQSSSANLQEKPDSSNSEAARYLVFQASGGIKIGQFSKIDIFLKCSWKEMSKAICNVFVMF